jgi:hypothetical protein
MIEPIVVLVPSALMAFAVVASLAWGKTLSLWPADGRILDSRTLQPARYWLSVAFYGAMFVFSLASVWRLPTKAAVPVTHGVEATLGGWPPAFVAAVIAVPLGLNVVYYRMKSRAAGKGEWRRFWYVAWLLLLTVSMCPEVFSLSLPSPLWKPALIPLIALALSSFNVAVSGFGSAPDKSDGQE